jgi:hypothetical protein
MRFRLPAALALTLLASSVITAPQANAATCSWTYRKPTVTGTCYGQSVALTYRRNMLTGFIGDRSISVVRNGALWSGFAGQDPVTLTRMAGQTFSGIVGGQGVVCSGPVPVTCLA